MTYSVSKPVSTVCRAVITRADGRVEDLGVIAFRHKNFLKHIIGNIPIKIKELRRKYGM